MRKATTFGLAAVLAGGMCAGVATADFSGPYDPANWTFDADGTDASVDTSGAPGEITITGGNDGVGGMAKFTIEVPEDAPAGAWAFDWEYTSDDSGDFDTAGFIRNDVEVTLALNVLAPASGSFTTNVQPGDTIGFFVETDDGLFGPGELRIFNFSAPVPAPGALALLGIAGLAGARRRRRG